ncbi:MAG: NAD(P)-dependent alcohol dehydrogenase [Hyphomicrobiaceae bacterium]
MRAAICEAYGGPEVVSVREVPALQPKPGEILIRTRAATVTSGDARVRGANFPPGMALPVRLFLGIRRPRKPILGTELAGTVAAVGRGVSKFQVGDAVFAFSGGNFGCHAELKTMPEGGAVCPLPRGASFEEAAALSFAGTTALYFLRDLGTVKPGERVLVNGASGAVGMAAVQIARHLGAHVTGVCSAANIEAVRALGAQDVIDYATTDFAASGERWDAILDAVGNAPFTRSKQALAQGGRLLAVVAGLGDMLKAPVQSLSGSSKALVGVAPERAEDLATLKSLYEAGVYKPVIDSRYPLADVAKAHAHVDTGRKTGSVLVIFD